MNYLYHRVPKDMEGNILFPLNKIKDIFPRIYAKEIDKYQGREHITQQRIPFLNCFWNDVLHLSAVQPLEIKNALIEAGYKAGFNLSCYQIDPYVLNKENTIVYLQKQELMKDKMNPSNFIHYDPDVIGDYSSLPDLTKDYYKEMIKVGKEPLLFHGVVHILFKGNLDVENLKIVMV